MKSPKIKWESIPIINYIFRYSADDMIEFQKIYMWMHSLPSQNKMKPVEYFKHKLGRQRYIFVGEAKNYVWEGDDWRVFVSNKQGISFELRENLTKEKVIQAWNEYLNLIS